MGDVVGHGIGAASLMGQLRHATRAYAQEGHSPAVVLDRLDCLVRSLDGGQMATLVYLVVEPDLSLVRLASAGHVPPLVIRPDGRGRYLWMPLRIRRWAYSTPAATPSSRPSSSRAPRSSSTPTGW